MSEVEKIRQERDEARAEIDRLRDFIESLVEERDDARAEVEQVRSLYIEARVDGFRDGRKAGAEAMREAAAMAFDYPNMAGGSGVLMGHKYVANNIRALPIPEDKP